MKKTTIEHGYQFRDDDIGIIVNWYPKKGTVYVQKNIPDLDFPKQAFRASDISDVFESYKHHVVPEKPTIGICCDAGTRGNPGPAEYNVADLNGKILEHKELGVRTNNYAELSGILAALNYCKANGIDLLWTDSQVSMQWIENGQPGKDVHDRDELIKLLSRIDHILSNTTITIRKWHTDIWGEIPADFGRK